MLELRPGCECCNKDLPPSAADAMICTFECTFCRDCVETRLNGVCPNCGGNFAPRPVRPSAKLAKFRRRPAVSSIRPAAAVNTSREYAREKTAGPGIQRR